MAKEFIIRNVRFEDFNDLVNDYFSYYSESRSNRDIGITLFRRKPTLKEEVAWFKEVYSKVLDGNMVMQVAEADGAVIGLCSVARQRPGSELDHTGILGIAVKKAYRGQGIGHALIESTLKRCKGAFEQVTLEVFDSNVNAQDLYKKMGFREYGRLPKAIKRGRRYIDAKLMYLRL